MKNVKLCAIIIMYNERDIYMDDENTLYAYTATDTLQQHDILDLTNPGQKTIDDYFKAILQSYTTHIRKKSYVVPQQK